MQFEKNIDTKSYSRIFRLQDWKSSLCKQIGRFRLSSFILWCARTIFHKLLKKENRGPYKLDANVKNTQLRTLFPITLPSSIFTETLNCRLLPFYKGNSKILDEYYDVIICDYPYFYPLIKHLKYFSLIYRPTDDYLAMGGDKVRAYESRICIEATKNSTNLWSSIKCESLTDNSNLQK